MPDDFSRALVWMGEAWELARRHGAARAAPAASDERWEQLARLRAVLARLSPPP
jgi:hypothetical protein